MTRSVVWTQRAVRDAARLDPPVRARILIAIDRIAEGHPADVVRLADVQPPEWRLRVGDWRVRFRYAAGRIEILRVLPRGKAYR